MSNLFNPPQVFALPLSMGQDLAVDFQNEDTTGAPLNYPVGTVVTLIIDGPTPVNTTATISTNHAQVFVAYTTTDQILARQTWRCVVTVPGSPATHVVACNGTTIRSDGT